MCVCVCVGGGGGGGGGEVEGASSVHHKITSAWRVGAAVPLDI